MSANLTIDGDPTVSDPPPESSPGAAARWRWLGSGWVLFIVVLALFWISPVNATQSDPAFVPLTAHSLLYDGDLDLDEFPSSALLGHPLVITGSGQPPGIAFSEPQPLGDARSQPGTGVYDYFPWTTSLLLIPTIAVNDAVAAVTGGENSRDLILQQAFGAQHRLTAGVVVALAAVLMRAAFVGLISGSRDRRRWIATGSAAVFALGTPAWSTASRALWQHAPSLLALAAALYLVTRLLRPADESARLTPTWTAVLLGCALSAAAISRPTNVFFAVAIAVWVLIRQRREVLPMLGGAAVVAALFVAASGLIGPAAVPPYYEGSRFLVHARFGEALGANIVSPGRGLLWAAPVTLLALPGFVRLVRSPHTRVLAMCLAASVVGIWISVSGFDNWWAGHSYGARFMTEAVPLLFFLAMPAVDGLFRGGDRPYSTGRVPFLTVTVVLALWSVGFNGLGATSRVVGCWNTIPENVDEHPERIWDLGDSAFARPLRYLVIDLDPKRAWFGPC